jgi:anthranilate synthase/aminodeoxychorismate synthase-like glutamine amidotransferase
MWVLIDNYDSFTWILRDYLLQTGYDCHVYRNDEITLAQLEALQPERLILSPGPETPAQAGITMAAINRFHNSIPILGVCLGHQALGMYFGAALVRAAQPMHGKTSMVTHNSSGVFAHLPEQLKVMRYHSLVLEEPLPAELLVTCRSEDGTIMALQHNHFPCTGVQFHPESIGTEHGLDILHNWAHMYR